MVHSCFCYQGLKGSQFLWLATRTLHPQHSFAARILSLSAEIGPGVVFEIPLGNQALPSKTRHFTDTTSQNAPLHGFDPPTCTLPRTCPSKTRRFTDTTLRNTTIHGQRKGERELEIERGGKFLLSYSRRFIRVNIFSFIRWQQI